jgi:hypothetical protein
MIESCRPCSGDHPINYKQKCLRYFQVKDAIFRKNDSGSQHGTTEWSMNVSHSSNAKKGPKEDLNAFKEFTDIETDAQLIVAAMSHFNMKKFEGKLIISY